MQKIDIRDNEAFDNALTRVIEISTELRRLGKELLAAQDDLADAVNAVIADAVAQATTKPAA